MNVDTNKNTDTSLDCLIDEREDISIVSDEELFAASELLLKQNREAYEALAK